MFVLTMTNSRIEKNVYYGARRKRYDYNIKNTSKAFVAGFVLAILVKKSYILSRGPFMLKKY